MGRLLSVSRPRGKPWEFSNGIGTALHEAEDGVDGTSGISGARTGKAVVGLS